MRRPHFGGFEFRRSTRLRAAPARQARRGYSVNQRCHKTVDAKEALQPALSRLRCALQFLTMLQTILAQAQTAAPQAMPGGGIGSCFVSLIFIFIIMYFVMIRPQKNRQQQQKSLISMWKDGDRVLTNAGIDGLISTEQ